jgi:hypothetical protein
MKAAVLQATSGDFLHGRHVDWTAIGAGTAETHIID